MQSFDGLTARKVLPQLFTNRGSSPDEVAGWGAKLGQRLSEDTSVFCLDLL